MRIKEYDRGFKDGRQAGYEECQRKWQAVMAQSDRVKTQLTMMEAVTKLVSAAGQSIQAVAQVFDNGPR